MTEYTCRVCGSNDVKSIYSIDKIPPFQNRSFKTFEEARSVPIAQVNLLECGNCAYIYNHLFQNDLMTYDADYQNMQGHSASFQNHLDNILSHVTSNIEKGDKIVEIGCGKGVFFDMMREKGYDVVGYDPAYEGNNENIIKAFFDESQGKELNPDVVVMRHTLEHIEDPHLFLDMLAKGCQADTKVFIEIPRYEWIAKNQAFWDIFHEHCNYFTETFFENIFSSKATVTPVFESQYMLVIARLGDLNIDLANRGKGFSGENLYAQKMNDYQQKISTYKNNIVWGSGAKGVAFANTLDPECKKISRIVDINPKKQNNYIGMSGHLCVSPDDIDWAAINENDCLWIMNENYKDEILASIPPVKCTIEVL